MTKLEECHALEQKFFDKFGKKVNVLFGEVPNLGEWFYIPRKMYDGCYRLGITFSSAERYIETIMDAKYLPLDFV